MCAEDGHTSLLMERASRRVISASSKLPSSSLASPSRILAESSLEASSTRPPPSGIAIASSNLYCFLEHVQHNMACAWRSYAQHRSRASYIIVIIIHQAHSTTSYISNAQISPSSCLPPASFHFNPKFKIRKKPKPPLMIGFSRITTIRIIIEIHRVATKVDPFSTLTSTTV